MAQELYVNKHLFKSADEAFLYAAEIMEKSLTTMENKVPFILNASNMSDAASLKFAAAYEQFKADIHQVHAEVNLLDIAVQGSHAAYSGADTAVSQLPIGSQTSTGASGTHASSISQALNL